jgi:threonine dehydrogenase-like Zn-dependent dehydrogenase
VRTYVPSPQTAKNQLSCTLDTDPRQWAGHGINLPGGFAEYCAYPQAKVFKIHNLSDVDATLIEPASCAAHGLDRIRPRLGSSVLMFGAGPTGLVSLPFFPFPFPSPFPFPTPNHPRDTH